MSHAKPTGGGFPFLKVMPPRDLPPMGLVVVVLGVVVLQPLQYRTS
jgi:hypothetical protein